MENILKHKHSLLEYVDNNWPEAHQNICVGLSGGVDSVVLLHILKQLRPQINLTAIHVNHSLSPNADAWGLFCQKFCGSLNIPLHIEKITITRSGGESLENQARLARHNILFQSNAEVIAMAHHQNDQVETILSQLFRGSDLHNIAAMHVISMRQGKILWRPLLKISRAQIEEYAKEFKLEYITDESNLDTSFLRNFIRHDVLPLLNKWDSNIVSKILNFNGQLQQTLAITDEVGGEDLARCCADRKDIDVGLFKQLSNYRQINLLSQFIKSNNLPLPSSKQLIEFTKQAISSNWDRKPQLKLNNGVLLVKYKNNIYLTKA
ncbi:MAG: tilS [Burkholderiales bacterium]|jgi:tRNA(Ile)-lysidine synthase|nr:tilS [Burkholderiales bacterium]